jgi:tetratricopeptide (TPR) repeat protein
VGIICTSIAVALLVNKRDELAKANNQLERNNAELLAAQEQLSEAFLKEAIQGAMAGNEAETKAAVDKLPESARRWRLVLLALLADSKGQFDEAISLLRQAVELEPGSVAAHALLATSYINAGRADDQTREVLQLSQLNIKDRDPFDRFFKWTTESCFWNVGPAVTGLQELVDERPGWELARVNLARALVYAAWDSGDWEKAAEAARMISASKERLPNLMSVYSVEFFANLVASQLAPESVVQAEQWRENVDSAAQLLEEKFPEAAFRERAIYYYHQGDIQKAIDVLVSTRKDTDRSSAASFYAAMCFGSKSYGEMKSDDAGFGPLAVLELFEDREVAARQIRAYMDHQSGMTVRNVWGRAPLCVLGYKDEAMQQWRKMLDREDDFMWNIEYPLKIFTGRWSPNEALTVANDSKIRQSLAHYAIAFKYLYIDGDRDNARKHFEECIKPQFINVDYYYWAKSYLVHLTDPDWPRWLAER